VNQAARKFVRLSTLWLSVQFGFNACGFDRYERLAYPKKQPLNLLDAGKDCPILLPAYQLYLHDMVAFRCTDGCHSPNGSGRNTFRFQANDDLANLNVIFGISPDVQWIFDKASGRLPHLGGNATIPRDKKSLENVFQIKSICEEPL